MNKEKEEVEIDLLELGKKLWDNKKFIIKCFIVGAVIGLIIAFSIPKEYTTTMVLMPETQSGSEGTMGSLAALAGINISNSMGNNILASPDLYPSVLESTPFLRGLLDIRVKNIETEIDTTLYSYMSDYQRKPWWSYIIASPKLLIKSILPTEKSIEEDDNIRFISEEESLLLQDLKERITVSSEKKTGVTTITITMQDAKISSFLGDSLTSYFQHYIIDYRTQKARKDLDYAEKLYNDSKNDYHEAQQQLAMFIDANKNVVSAKYHTTQDKLQNETNLAYSVYTQTAQQRQLAKVKVQDNTPVFTIIQPAVEPLKASKPSKAIILIGVLFLTFVTSTCWILRQDLASMLK